MRRPRSADAEADDAVSVVVFTGAGRVFSGGVDITEMTSGIPEEGQPADAAGAGPPTRSGAMRAQLRRVRRRAAVVPETTHGGGERSGRRHRVHDVAAL